MTSHKLIITPRTKVAELLQAYPKLEDVLIDLAPALEKLKNPVLRDTIMRITSLQQAASVGEISVETIVNKLRGIVGQEALEDIEGAENIADGQPEWFHPEKIAKTMDARESIAAGGHPVGQVLSDLNDFESGKIYELVTPFLPAPLLDKVINLGYLCWTKKENESLFRSFFYR